jgi:hypothetical protein
MVVSIKDGCRGLLLVLTERGGDCCGELGFF